MNRAAEYLPDPELVALVESYCDDLLDDDGAQRLEAILLQDFAARAYFRRYLGLDALLYERGNEDWSYLPGEHLSTRPAPRRWSLQFAGSVALLAALAMFGFVLYERDANAVVGTLERVTGDVRLISADGQARTVVTNASIAQGDTVRTRGDESSTVVAYPDGTRLTLVGNTSVTCGDHRTKCIVVHQGTVAASVRTQSAEKPLLLTTPSAQLQVLGTRFQVEAMENRTDLNVTEGRVRLVRIRDQQTVEVPNGKCASVTEQNALLVNDIPKLTSTWTEDCESGPPEGWERGSWIGAGLPPGSKGAMKATWGEITGGGTNFCLSTHDAWLQGLFAVEANSHLHFTFKTESQRWINIFICTRTAGSEDVRFSGNYLLDDFPKTGSGQWETVSIPLSKFKRIHAGKETLLEVVPIKLLFAFDQPDRKLVVDRIWITTDGPDEITLQAAP